MPQRSGEVQTCALGGVTLAQLLEAKVRRSDDLAGVPVPVLREVMRVTLEELGSQLGEDLIYGDPSGECWARCEICLMIFGDDDVIDLGGRHACAKCHAEREA